MLISILKRASIRRIEKREEMMKKEEEGDVEDIRVVVEVDMEIRDNMMIERLLVGTKREEKRWNLKLMMMKKVKVQRISPNSNRQKVRKVEDRTRKRT